MPSQQHVNWQVDFTELSASRRCDVLSAGSGYVPAISGSISQTGKKKKKRKIDTLLEHTDNSLHGTDLQLRLTSVDVIGGLVEFLQLPLEDMKQHSEEEEEEEETGTWYNMWSGGTGGGMSNIWKQ